MQVVVRYVAGVDGDEVGEAPKDEEVRVKILGLITDDQSRLAAFLTVYEVDAGIADGAPDFALADIRLPVCMQVTHICAMPEPKATSGVMISPLAVQGHRDRSAEQSLLTPAPASWRIRYLRVEWGPSSSCPFSSSSSPSSSSSSFSSPSSSSASTLALVMSLVSGL